MNEPGVSHESEFVLRRFGEAFPFAPADAAPAAWVAVTAAVLALGVAFVVWMYARDNRSVRWFFAAPLALLRVGVYLLLAVAFLLPAHQTWEKAEKRSRVVVVLDVSPSVAQVRDEVATAGGPSPKTRLDKVLDFLGDDKIAFLRTILEKNPVSVYRFGARLDDEPEVWTADRPAWARAEWDAWARYDFKPWVLRNLSPAGREAVAKTAAWKGAEPGTADWATAYAKAPDAEAVPADLAPADAAALRTSRGKLDARVDVVRAVAGGTDLPGSLLAAVNREAGNMVQGVVVFSDGRSNGGSEAAALAELRERAGREKIPVFTVAVGETRENVGILLTDVQAPDRAPPDEPFKVVVEADGVGLAGQGVEVRLGLYLPGKDPRKDAADHELTERLTFQPGEPPHGQAEFVVDPDKLPEGLTEESKKIGRKRQLKPGAWAAVARVARDRREVFADADHLTPPRVFQVLDKPLRVLLFAGGPTREYQTLRTLLAREASQNRAELSVCLQSEAGREGTAVQDVAPDRLLTKFPTRLDTTGGKPTDKPEDKYYNLNEYDLIVAIDPDWSELSEDQVKNIQGWVDNLGGGLVYVAGPVFSPQLARAAEDGRLKPLLDVLPVLPDDIILLKSRPITRTPRRLALKPSPETDLLKLEDGTDDPTAGWEPYFTYRAKYTPDADPRRNAAPSRGFYAYYPVKAVKPGATVLAEFLDPNERGDADPKPWLVLTQPSRGRTVFLASGEIWRLRTAAPEYYDRFWVKLARYAAANRDAKAARGRVLMGKEFASGAPVRVQARLLDPSGRPYPEGSLRPKFVVRRLTSAGERLPTKNDRGQEVAAPDLGPFELKSKKGGAGFDGYYAGQVLADPRVLPPGDFRYRVIVDVPDSPGDTLEGDFLVKRSDPELDNPRPDFAALVQAAGTLDEVRGRIADPATYEALKGTAADGGTAKLAFRLADPARVGLIPQCFKAERQDVRLRGPVEDLWDKGPTFDLGGQQVQVAWLLLAAVGLLAVEWMCRKLLRLA